MVESDVDDLLRLVRTQVGHRDTALAEYLIGSLDQHGILDGSPAELASRLGVEERAVVRVLAVIRRSGPPGVGAASVNESLLLQLFALPDVEDSAKSLASAVIQDHLTALARGHFAAIAAALGVERDAVQPVLDLIRERLRPYPAFDGRASKANQYIVPDLIVSRRDDPIGAFRVELVEPLHVRLGVRVQVSARGSHSPDQDRFRESVHRARSLLTHLGDRWETMRRVAECAIERQNGFLRRGPVGLQSLTRAEVANELGLHESTVSRAVAEKYVLLPSRKIIPLAAFFTTSGGLDEELRGLIRSETSPLSDQQISNHLRQRGYPVARRTVAKHRARLGISAASRR